MEINITKEVYEGGELNHLFKHQGNWYGASNDQIWNIEENPINELYIVTEEYLFARIPKLRGQLNQPNKTTVAIDYSTGEVNINKQHKHFGLVDHKARASRQANIKFNYFHYLSLHKEKVSKKSIKALVLFVAGILVHWILFVPLVLFVVYNLLKLFASKNGYQAGDLGPAIVLDPDNSKIAALTDMSLGLGVFPIVRVMMVPLPKEYKVKGKRLAVAGGFQNTHKYDHWNYYIPQPIVAATNDENVISNSFSRIPNKEWLKLESELKNFNSIPLEGYYPIDIETSSWNGRNLEDIHWNNFGKEKANINPSERKRMEEKEELDKKKAEFKKSTKELGPSFKKIYNDTKNDIKDMWEEEGRIAEEKKKRINKKLGQEYIPKKKK